MVDQAPQQPHELDACGFLDEEGIPTIPSTGTCVGLASDENGDNRALAMKMTVDGQFNVEGMFERENAYGLASDIAECMRDAFGESVHFVKWNDPSVKPVPFHTVLLYVKDTPPFEEHMFDVGCWNDQTNKWVRSIGGEDEEVEIFCWMEIPAYVPPAQDAGKGGEAS